MSQRDHQHNNNMELDKDNMNPPDKGNLDQMEIADPSVQKIPYPKGVFFVMATELSERFSYYGMRAVLTIYMRNVLAFSENTATSYYHVFLLLCYGLPLFWGVISDSWLGKFRTIVYVSILFALGNIILTLSSIPPLHLPTTAFFFIGLFLMALGTGGMKPCVAPLGGEQYVLPQQSKQLEQFFSVFFFVITIGNMVSTVITPIFRRDVSCFDMDNCYPLAFGVPASIMLLAIVIFVSGKSLYKITKPDGNMLVKVTKCVVRAISNKRKKRSSVSSGTVVETKPSSQKKRHWLDNAASDDFDDRIIDDTKGLFRILPYFIPVPMFYALYEQLGSRWTLQATRMNGRIGNFSIKPDQMQVSNAILMFVSLPLFNYVVYPLLHKCGIRLRTLQRMVVGGLLAAASFSAAGVVSLKIDPSINKAPDADSSILNVANIAPCPLTLVINPNSSTATNFTINADTFVTIPEAAYVQPTNIRVVSTGTGGKCSSKEWTGQVSWTAGAYQSIRISQLLDETLSVSVLPFQDDYKKSKDGNGRMRFILEHQSPAKNASVSDNKADQNLTQVVLTPSGKGDTLYFELHESSLLYYSEVEEVPDDEFTVSVQALGTTINLPEKLTVRNGGSYNLYVYASGPETKLEIKSQLVTITPENDIHILWLLPQYALMAWGEILFIVSGMEFAYTEAPVSMKSVVQGIWHLMNAVGNLIVIISAQSHGDESAGAINFFIFSGLMFIDAIVYFIMSRRYKLSCQLFDNFFMRHAMYRAYCVFHKKSLSKADKKKRQDSY